MISNPTQFQFKSIISIQFLHRHHNFLPLSQKAPKFHPHSIFHRDRKKIISLKLSKQFVTIKEEKDGIRWIYKGFFPFFSLSHNVCANTMWAINLRCYYYLIRSTTHQRVVHFTFPFSPLLVWKCSMEGKWKEVVHKCYHIFHKFYYGFCFLLTLSASHFAVISNFFSHQPLNFFCCCYLYRLHHK